LNRKSNLQAALLRLYGNFILTLVFLWGERG
jgi:hypothetical protein